ncbi:MAG: hypothetical protein MRZ79_00230 [Bacteroidia bacterium]|nr:hypothetical protein [Bacteroidia bacterium]
MMKHIWILFLMLSLGSSLAFGQRKRPFMDNMNSERLETMRIAHYSNWMKLKTSEAQVFWPWFNEREEKMKQVRKQMKMKQRQMQQAISEDDEKAIEKILDSFINYKLQEVQLESEYHTKLKEILPIRKVVLFYRAEREWEKKLIAYLKKRRDGDE